MNIELQPLIDQVQACTHTHVVVFLEELGIRWRCLPESSCEVIAQVLKGEYDPQVMTKDAFVQLLEKL